MSPPEAKPSPSRKKYTQLLVDELILDYLLHQCSAALLREWKASTSTETDNKVIDQISKGPDRCLMMINSFLQTYQYNHGSNGYDFLSRSVRLRLLVCRFLSVFLRRLDPCASFAKSPQTTILRAQRQRKARLTKFLERRQLSHSFPTVAMHCEFLEASTGSHTIAAESISEHYKERYKNGGHTGPISRISAPRESMVGMAGLADSLPLFMVISAWSAAILYGGPVNNQWMSLALSFMRMAFIEDYLCHGTPAVDALSENFAWGVVPVEVNPDSQDGDGLEEDTMEEIVVNEMFAMDGGEVSIEWEGLKKAVFAEIVPAPPIRDSEASQEKISLENHLLELMRKEEQAEGVAAFVKLEKRVIKMLSAVVEAMEVPVLSQLEQGKLRGCEQWEVQALLHNSRAHRWFL